MNTTFYSYSFGCRVNEAEKEQIDRQMLEAGFQYSRDDPSVYIINTCSVTKKAEREARQHIYQVKRRFPGAKIVITGCSATYWKKNSLNSHLPVEEIYDNVQKEYLVKLLQKRFPKKEYSHPTGDLASTSKFLGSGRLLVKIQDGCQRFCSFCIVPYLRGLPHSKHIAEIVREIQSAKEIKEVVLTAINTEAYGYDTGESFIDLVKKIIEDTDVSRISFGSIHPWSINEGFFKFYKNILPKKRLVDFFHIPLQSGSNTTLRLMKRGYTKEEILEKLQSIKRLNEFAFIGTDVIVGFLDETDRDFENSYDFFERAPINKFHVFRFSKRQNTAAYYLSKRLQEAPDHVKKNRAKLLLELGVKKYQLFLQKHLLNIFSGLFLKSSVEGFQQALLSNQIPVFVKTPKDYTAEIKNIKVTEYKSGKLFGKIV